jgi:Protein of unknown function (DUF3187)
MTAAGSVAAIAAALLAAAAAAGEAPLAPERGLFAVRDQNPLLRPFYLPTVRLAGAEGLSTSAVLAWSNTVNLPATATESAWVDEETAEIGFGVRYRSGDWLWAAQLPVVWRGNGVLDGVIHNYHSLLGFTEGDRPRVPRYSYRVTYTGADHATATVERGAALGDVPLEVGRVLYERAGTELSAWLGLTLPTGSQRHGTGGAGIAGAGWLAGALPLGDRTQLSGQVGVVHYGSAAELPRIHPTATFGTVGANVRVTRRLALVAQLDAHSAIADSELRVLKPALVLSYGGRFALSPTLGLDFGMQEDAATNRSPDVTFYFGLNSHPQRR